MTVSSQTLEHERHYLVGVAYRMLGSASDAEDVVQEALARAPAPGEVRSLRAYLTTVVTRLCLDELRSARRQRELYVGPWLPEPVLTDAVDAPADTGVEHRESVSFAMLAVLETLSPLERAVFLLREVFDFPFDEIATALERSEPACRKLLQRARVHIQKRKLHGPAATPEQLRITNAFFRALSSGDLHEVVELLAEDAVAITDHGGKASAARRPVVGASDVARFLVGLASKRQRVGRAHTLEAAFLNGAPAAVTRLADGTIASAVLPRIQPTPNGPRIVSVYIVRNPDKLRGIACGLQIDVQ